MRILWAILVSLALTFSALATEAPKTIPWTSLVEFESNPNETLDQFALRIASTLDDYTARHEVEVCGIFGQAENGIYGVILGTIGGALVCINDPTKVPVGMTALSVGIHSHPNPKTIRPTPIDRLLASRTSYANLSNLVKNNGRYGFSTADFQHEGYLVAGGRVWHQKGPKTVREVGRLSNPASYRSFDPR